VGKWRTGSPQIYMGSGKEEPDNRESVERSTGGDGRKTRGGDKNECVTGKEASMRATSIKNQPEGEGKVVIHDLRGAGAWAQRFETT